jgi:hypothetical protein
MCNNGMPETIDHLFFDCPFAQDCWAAIQINWDESLDLLDRLIRGRDTHQLPFFTEAGMIAAWELWTTRSSKEGILHRHCGCQISKVNVFSSLLDSKRILGPLFASGLMLSVNFWL